MNETGSILQMKTLRSVQDLPELICDKTAFDLFPKSFCLIVLMVAYIFCYKFFVDIHNLEKSQNL